MGAVAPTGRPKANLWPRGWDGWDPQPPKSQNFPFYAFPELFRGQILAIHTQTFGKTFRKPVLTRTFAKSNFFQPFSDLVLSREYIFQGESPAHFSSCRSRHLASKEASGAFASFRARRVSIDEPVFSPNAMRNCLIINRNVSKVALKA